MTSRHGIDSSLYHRGEYECVGGREGNVYESVCVSVYKCIGVSVSVYMYIYMCVCVLDLTQ